MGEAPLLVVEKKDADVDDPQPIQGPAAQLKPLSLLVVNKAGEQSSNLVTLQNLGSTCLFYTWERRPMERLCPKKVAGGHLPFLKAFTGNMSRPTHHKLLHILRHERQGSVSSGEKKEFSFKFRSDMPGTFMENWELIVAPKLPVQLKPLQVKGVALVDDKNSANRDRLDEMLDYREKMLGVHEAYEEIVGRVKTPVLPVRHLPRKSQRHQEAADKRRTRSPHCQDLVLCGLIRKGGIQVSELQEPQ